MTSSHLRYADTFVHTSRWKDANGLSHPPSRTVNAVLLDFTRRLRSFRVSFLGREGRLSSSASGLFFPRKIRARKPKTKNGDRRGGGGDDDDDDLEDDGEEDDDDEEEEEEVEEEEEEVMGCAGLRSRYELRHREQGRDGIESIPLFLC